MSICLQIPCPYGTPSKHDAVHFWSQVTIVTLYISAHLMYRIGQLGLELTDNDTGITESLS